MRCKLDVNKDYLISKKYPLESFLTPEISILSVFGSTKTKLGLNNVYTPKEFMKNKTNNQELLLIYEPELMVHLDYLETLNLLRKSGHNFIAYTSTTEDFPFLVNPIIYCVNQEFHIKAIDNERYYFLYHICKNRLFEGSVFLYAENHEYKKIELLLGVFLGKQIETIDTVIRYKNNVMLSSNIKKQFYNNVIVFGDRKIGMYCDRMVYVCEKIDAKLYTFDFEQVKNEIYRLDDLIRSLTKNVIMGRNKVNLDRFNSLRCA